MRRRDDIKTFYLLMDDLAERTNGPRYLSNCSGRDNWPERGVYFFFENGELRTDSGNGLRVVRVGTHCISKNSKTRFWTRLSQHRGLQNGGGNHRGSIFRQVVGEALGKVYPEIHTDTWLDIGASIPLVKEAEYPLECRVSDYIRNMPFLWVTIGDPASKNSRRAYIERNTIALLSNHAKIDIVDVHSQFWLGQHSSNKDIRSSGLWNSRHVNETYDPDFLNELEHYISKMT